jgi:hypothetical protein
MSNHSATFRLYGELMAKPKTKKRKKIFCAFAVLLPNKEHLVLDENGLP